VLLSSHAEKAISYQLDYENLTEIGSIMGSGSLIVTDETTCMVDMAKIFLGFTQKESCGKCVPCRLGTKNMLETLTAISKGKATLEDLDQLFELAQKPARSVAPASRHAPRKLSPGRRSPPPWISPNASNAAPAFLPAGSRRSTEASTEASNETTGSFQLSEQLSVTSDQK
jgi:hypothetical protein